MGAMIPPGLAALLRTVEKPGRYVGGEFGAVIKPDAALRVALSYPDLYEIGMSNSAIRILYNELNRLPDVACERVFAPAPDFEAALRAAAEPLRSLESHRALSEFDLIGFSLGYELTLTNLLAILDTGGVCLETARRGGREPIVIVGGPAATNPVPLGLFADVVFIGEAEGWIAETFTRLAEMKRRGAVREDLLALLRSQPSIWHPGKAGAVCRAYWRGFSSRAAETALPVPSMRVVQDHGTVEIMRGCPNACRFCHASVLYRPARRKALPFIESEVRALVEGAGYRQITLSSLSSGDFRGIDVLVRDLNARYASQKVSFALPSLRVDSLSLGLLGEISEVRKSGLTFAVEAASPQWQREVRKTVGLDKVIGLMKEARSHGWKAAKFYFMVGLPPAAGQDEAAPIVEFLRAVKSATGMSLNVNVAAFIPKPHTPWQRAAQIGEERALDSIMAVKRGLAGTGFKVGYHAPILALLEGIVSRGDERAGRLVLDAYHRGARLDAWEEHVNLPLWRDVIAQASWDVLGETCRARQPDEHLPWDGISLALSTSDVRGGDAAPADRAVPDGSAVDGVDQDPPRPRGDAVPAAAADSPTVAPWVRVVFLFSKSGAAAFISHLDLMTVFERAIVRAGYSARFTEGYNPKPRLEFANPLSLGITSEEEAAAVDLHDFDSAESFVRRLNSGLPEDLRVQRAALAGTEVYSRRRSLMSLYWGADFEVTEGEAAPSRMRVPASGPSVKKLLQLSGAWETAAVRRTSIWAVGPDGRPVTYFEALCAPPEADSAPPEADSAPPGSSALT
jgi:radical SAM superfamily enzyme YgiQ (UPF0313 family)